MSDDDAAIRRQSTLSSAFRSSVGPSRCVHSLMLSIHLLVCLPLRLPPSSVPWRTVLARELCRVTCPNHEGFLFFAVAKRGSWGPALSVTCFITKSFVFRSALEMPRRRLKHLVLNVCTLREDSAVIVQL
ncbi:hypothetical protein ACOMHN_061886 [Nucella lapillus]